MTTIAAVVRDFNQTAHGNNNTLISADVECFMKKSALLKHQLCSALQQEFAAASSSTDLAPSAALQSQLDQFAQLLSLFRNAQQH